MMLHTYKSCQYIRYVGSYSFLKIGLLKCFSMLHNFKPSTWEHWIWSPKLWTAIQCSLLTPLVAQMVKNLPAMRDTWLWSLDQEDPLEKGIATHSRILAWRIPWTEEPDGLQSTGSRRGGHSWAITFTWCLLPGLNMWHIVSGKIRIKI